MERAYAALTNAVIEALFTGTQRRKEGAIPTPAEFRAALMDAKENARSKAKRQRNDALEETSRLQQAISVLVGTRTYNGAHSRPVEPESDDSGDDLAGMSSVPSGRRDWTQGYESRK